MRSFRFLIILVVIGLAAVGFVVLRLLARGSTQVSDAGGTFVEGVVGAPQAINPLLCDENEADRDLCRLVFSGLSKFNEFGDVVPDLATSWNVAEGGITYTFKLRNDAKWHDGIAVSADDVVFTVHLIQDPAFPGRADLAKVWRTVKVNKIDNTTVQFALQQPYSPFMDLTTIGLLPQHILTGTTAADLRTTTFNLEPKGSGAWKLEGKTSQVNRITSVSLAANDAYYGERPKLDHITFKYFSNSPALLEGFRNRDVDGMANLAPPEQAKAAALPNVTSYTARQYRYAALFINQRKDSGAIALTEKPVRQALMLALDRDAIVREALGGQGIVADSPFIPGTWAYDSNVKHYPHDVARAKQLLRDAGYELTPVAPTNVEVWQKNGEPLGFILLTPDSGTFQAVAEAIAKQWQALGVQVTVQRVRNIAGAFISQRQFQAALAEVLVDGDPDPYSMWHQSLSATGQNFTGWENKDASDLLQQARTTTDRSQRFELYKRFQGVFAEELPALLLYYPTYRYFVSSDVHDVQIAPIMYASDRLRGLSQWTVNVKRVPVAEASAQPQ